MEDCGKNRDVDQKKKKKKRKTRKTENEETINKVLEFFNECRAQKIPVTGPTLQEAALKTASKLEDKNFSASNV